MTAKGIYAAPFREGDATDLEKSRKERVFFCKICDSFEIGKEEEMSNGRSCIVKCTRCGSIETDRLGNIIKYPIPTHS